MFSWQRNILHAKAFFKKVLEVCINKPLILIDKGPWYPEAFQLDLNGLIEPLVRENALNDGLEL